MAVVISDFEYVRLGWELVDAVGGGEDVVLPQDGAPTPLRWPRIRPYLNGNLSGVCWPWLIQEQHDGRCP